MQIHVYLYRRVIGIKQVRKITEIDRNIEHTKGEGGIKQV